MLKEEKSEGTLKRILLFNQPISSRLRSLSKKLGWNHKEISPGTLRYTFVTFLRALGVTEDAIENGLSLNCRKTVQIGLFDLEQYNLQIKAGQTVIEETFETLLMFHETDLMKINLTEIYQQLPMVYREQLQHEEAIEQIKQKVMKMVR